MGVNAWPNCPKALAGSSKQAISVIRSNGHDWWHTKSHSSPNQQYTALARQHSQAMTNPSRMPSSQGQDPLRLTTTVMVPVAVPVVVPLVAPVVTPSVVPVVTPTVTARRTSNLKLEKPDLSTHSRLVRPQSTMLPQHWRFVHQFTWRTQLMT